VYGARTALRLTATELSARQADLITDYPQQGGIRLRLDGDRRAVQVETDCHGFTLLFLVLLQLKPMISHQFVFKGRFARPLHRTLTRSGMPLRFYYFRPCFYETIWLEKVGFSTPDAFTE
jgi:hypothetical protein